MPLIVYKETLPTQISGEIMSNTEKTAISKIKSNICLIHSMCATVYSAICVLLIYTNHYLNPKFNTYRLAILTAIALFVVLTTYKFINFVVMFFNKSVTVKHGVVKNEDDISLLRMPNTNKYIEKVKSKNKYIKKFIVFRNNTAVKITNIKPLCFNPSDSDALIVSFNTKDTYIVTIRKVLM